MENRFVTVKTIHQGEITWWWTDEKLHDRDYHFKVQDAIDKKIVEVKKRYDIEQDTRYTCQFEGVQLTGGELCEVEEAARHIGQCLAKFKGVRPL